MDQVKQPRCGKRRGGERAPVDRRDLGVQSLQCDQAFRGTSASNYVRRSHVMSDAIHPGAKRTAMIEQYHAPPKFDMDLLQQVGSAIGIRLIGSGKPPKQLPADAIGLFVQRVLLAAIHRLVDSIVNSRAAEEDSYTRTLDFGLDSWNRTADVPPRRLADLAQLLRSSVVFTGSSEGQLPGYGVPGSVRPAPADRRLLVHCR